MDKNNPITSTNTTYLPDGKVVSKNDTLIDMYPHEEAKLYDSGKRWYIEYKIYNTGTEKLQKCREWVTSKGSDENRRILSKIRIDKINERLQSGWVIESLKPVNSDISTFLIELIKTKKKLRKKTIQGYESIINNFADFLAKRGVFTIAKITPNDCKAYLDSLSNLSDKTKENKIISLKGIFNFAVSEEKILLSPFRKIKLETKDNDDSEAHYPYSDYEKELLEEALKNKNYNLFLFTRFIFYAFLRPKEIINLRVSNINIQTKTIIVPSSESKTTKQRVIPIIKPLLRYIIENRLTEYPKGFYLFGKGLHPSDIKSPMNEATNLHREILKEIKIYKSKVTTLYAWKHTGNIHAYLKKVDLSIIQKLNGHKYRETTEIYLRKLFIFLESQAHEYEW